MSIEDKLIRGRPYGGVGIMWNKSLSHIVKIVKYDDNRILGIENIENFCASWRKIVRRLWKIPYRTHNSLVH